jgi:para-nitrobenzyl esterase
MLRILGGLALIFAVACGDDGSDVDSGTLDSAVMDGGGDAADAADAMPDAMPPPEIEVSYDHGTVVGRTIDGVHTFLGLPYAAPPVGTLRWRPPRDVTPWTEPRDASELGSKCPQFNVLAPAPELAGEEDCLTINVFTPDVAPSTPMPVFVWLHGGAFLFGRGNRAPGRLAAISGTVVVTLNYRLDLLGFMAHPDLTAEGEGASGNYGLMDQRAALEWVRDHIDTFGGDPGNVTLAGESAGGISTALHGVSPASSGLFHRAIVQSGPPGLVALPTLEEAEARGEAVATRLGCTDPATALACMRAASVDELIVEVDLTAPGTPPGGVFYQPELPMVVPNIDGDVLPEQPADAYVGGRFEMVPWLVGSNADEGTLFHTELLSIPVENEAEYLAALERTFPGLSGDVAAMYPVSDYPDANAALTAVTGDLFTCGTRSHARQMSDGGATVYLYAFESEPAGLIPDSLMLGSFHSAELYFLFETEDMLGAAPDDQRDLVDAVQGYWTRFTATGDPNGDSDPTWPVYETASDEHMSLASPPTAGSGHRQARCDFWAGLDLP